MGGHAYVIPGRLVPERLEREKPPSELVRPVSFWRKLVGARAPIAEPSVVQLANGDRLTEIPAAPLDPELIDDLRAWLGRRIAQPSRGTAVVVDYLDDSSPTVYVRGIHRANDRMPEHFVQVMFSGCAGEAETSARVAAHWTALWYAAEQARIASEHFAPFGFTPDSGVPIDDESMAFLPAGELGYLEYVPLDMRHDADAAFEMDHATAEAHADSPLLARLEDVFGGFMREGACRCQLCEPDFGDATFDERPVRGGGVAVLSAR